jgi:c-di-GMP-binding flagellar brake protein YcgR
MFWVIFSLTYSTGVIYKQQLLINIKQGRTEGFQSLSGEGIIMMERRRAPRLTEINDITITVMSAGNKSSQGNIIYNRSTDISMTGARIQSHVYLPVESLLKIKIFLKNPPQMITVFGKVKWIKGIVQDASYEAGIEFVDVSSEITHQLADYILTRQQLQDLDLF